MQNLLQWLHQQHPALNPICRTEHRLTVMYFRDTSPSVHVRDYPLPAPDMEETTANEAAGGRNKAAPWRPEGRSAKVPTVGAESNAKPSRQQKQLKQVNKQSHDKGGQTCGRCLHFAAKGTTVWMVGMSGLVKGIFFSLFVLFCRTNQLKLPRW